MADGGSDEAGGQPAEGMASSTRPPVRRKPRMIAICLECRRRKVKCDKQYPCSNCSKFSRECLYLAPAMEMMSRQRAVTTTPSTDSMSLDTMLEEETARVNLNRSEPTRQAVPLSLEDPDSFSLSMTDDFFTQGYEHYLEPIPTGAMTISYGDDYSDPELDLGISIGKMWMTDRIGGLFRPHIHKEIERMLNDPSSDRRTSMEKQQDLPTLADEGKNFLTTRFDYIEPRLMWDPYENGNRQPEALIDLLPRRATCDVLVERYLSSVHSITPVLHFKTFQQQYALFWRILMAGLEPAPWLRALVFSVLFAAAASIAAESAAHRNLAARITARDRLQRAVEEGLRASKVLHGTRLEALQALMISLLPMYGMQVSRAHTSLVGTIVLMSESMGLHKEVPPGQNITEAERHVRRLLWFHVSTLDLRVSYAHSPRLLIRPDGYITKMPLNIEEDKLGSGAALDERGWSLMTFCRMRFELVQMQKVVWISREAVERKTLRVTDCLREIERFRQDIESRYGRLLDLSHPLQKYTRLTMNLLIHMCYVMILFRYLRQYGQKVPNRLRQLTLHAAVLAMESAIEMDCAPELAQWKWHNGCNQQWQIAFLLLSHVNRTPDQPQSQRIWKIIDYVFEIEPSLSPAVKARSIMSTIESRTRAYQAARQVRVPENVNDPAIVNQQGSRAYSSNSGTSAALAPERIPAVPMFPVNVTESVAESTPFAPQLAPQRAMATNSGPNDQFSAGADPIDRVVADIAYHQPPNMDQSGMPPFSAPEDPTTYPSVSGAQPDFRLYTPGPSQIFTTPESYSSLSEPMGQYREWDSVDWDAFEEIFPHQDTFMDF